MTSLLSITREPNESAMDLDGDLFTLSIWAKQWFVTFNAEKTISLTFSTNKTEHIPPLYMDGTKVKEVTSHRHLGLIMSQGMSWGEHIRILTAKASQRIGILNVLKYKLSRDVLTHLYNSLVLPVLDYCDQIYDNCTVLQKASLESVHIAAARVCTGALKSTNINTLLQEELGWEKLETRRWRHKLFYFYKIVQKTAPSYLTQYLPDQNVNNPLYKGRSPLAFTPYKCKSKRFKNSFFPSCVSAWNSIGHNLQNIESLPSFKKAINRAYLTYRAPSYYGKGHRRQFCILS